MSNGRELIQSGILRDMSEGVLAIGMDGVITLLNPAAERILGKSAQEVLGRRFAACFFDEPENDAFNQTVLDAIYERKTSHENVVSYAVGERARQLHVTTSFLMDGPDKIGVIAVLSDITELYELRDAVRAMEQIRRLNGQLAIRNELIEATFGRFLSDDIVRQLLDAPDGLLLGGKKRVLTVLMSDLRGFTALSERMEATALIEMLNHYLGCMTEIIQKRNGTIIEFIGDGILAVFGAPTPNPSHASDAVAAAIEMQSEMERVNAWNVKRGWPALEMGVGVNTGEVIVGNIGSEKRTKYGVVGNNVNLCGRIESCTVGGQVLLSPGTRAEILEPLTIEDEAEVLFKGVNEPLTLYRVTGIGGRYGVSCCNLGEEPQKLKRPAPVTFFVLSGKLCEPTPSEGAFVALSKTGAVLQTDAALSLYDNLELSAGGQLFAKVVSKDEHGFTLRFTSIPPAFTKWYQNCVNVCG